MSLINSMRVDEIFRDCLYNTEDVSKSTEEELEKKAVKVDGITSKFGFNPEKIKIYEKEIFEVLLNLPNEFKRSSGGGWSFLNACVDKENNQWGEHQNIEQLMCLGLAIKKVDLQMPKEMWKMLPGGMPFFSVDDVK